MKNISQLDKAFSDYVTRLKAKLEEKEKPIKKVVKEKKEVSEAIWKSSWENNIRF